MRHESQNVYNQVAQKAASDDDVVPRSPRVFCESAAGAESGFEHPVDLRVPPLLRAVMLQMKVAAKKQSPVRADDARKIPVFSAVGGKFFVKSQGANRRPAINHAKSGKPLHRTASVV